ncbi:Accessory gene regulator B [Syntrophobotulus glycolicus DSM 8271]|uniref:Accessory gene regulator B n=1 Tax=Syntrophobotulus glycolicus (strain DSM 8271 / FlGlyR) TaxID=645991 RepID=F0T0I1_SYNGF|nr:accessory gene regulator B family protein [Syntrophobotulus glycolicus]ADY55046.1 Accessory gene regulator B [Syntrophobotulus glycolicus DSM 8271]
MSNLLSSSLDLNEEKEEELTYGFELIFLAVIGTASILLAAYFLDTLLLTALTLLFGGGLRKLSGGAHAGSAFKCLAIGTVVYAFLGLSAKSLIAYNLAGSTLNLVILLLCLPVVAILAPVDCPAKPIHSRSFRRKLKSVSIAFVLVTSILVFLSQNIILGTSAALGIAYQTVTLLPLFNLRKGGS